MYTVYILHSLKTKRRYIGQTQDLESRLHRHNSGQNSSTKSGIPWKVMAYKVVESRSEAMVLEKKLKNLKSTSKQDNFIVKNDFLKQEVIGPEKPDSF